MIESNEKFKWLKFSLQLLVLSLLSSMVFADNSTDYDMETLVLIEPAPPVYPTCGMNELYQNCEVDCIDCEQRGMCEPQNCDIAHCDCRMYFVHVTPGGPCEHVSVCPPRKCPENEVYRHCGPYCEACDMGPCRTMECSSRCYCKPGYRRNRETGECIPEKECPERLNCTSNDAVASSGLFNDHCLQTESEALRGNETVEEEKCYCPSGFKRNLNGWCIEETACIYVSCFEETEFQDCPRKCNTTCWNYGDPSCKEDDMCYPSCFCREGYVLNEFFACIPFDTCPPGSNPFVPPLPTAGPVLEPSAENSTSVLAMETAESGSGEAAKSSPDSGSTEESKSTAGSDSSVVESTEKSEETEPEETTPQVETTEAPKKRPKKVVNGGKVYKSAARPGKKVSSSSDASSSSKSSSAAKSDDEEGEKKEEEL